MNVFYVTIRKDSLEMHGRLAELSYLCTVKARQDARTMRLCAAHYFFVIMTHFVNGDNASFGQIWSGWTHGSVAKDTAFCFSSKWKWLVRAVSFAFLFGLIFTAVLFLVVVGADWLHGKPIRWGMGIALALVPMVIVFCVVLPATFRDSFMKPKKVVRRVDEFMARYLPDAEITARDWPAYVHFKWKGMPFGAQYYTYAVPVPYRRMPVSREGMEILMWYEPEDDAEVFDEDGGLTEEFAEEFAAFCKDKPACRDLFIDARTIYLQLDLKELWESERDLGASLDMFIYLTKRFHLIPMMNWNEPMTGVNVRDWMDVVMDKNAMPEGVKSLFIVVTQQKNPELYLAEVRFMSMFDAESREWLDTDDYVPGNFPYAFWDDRPAEIVCNCLAANVMLESLFPRIKAKELPEFEGLVVHFVNDDETWRFTRESIIQYVEVEE